MKTLNQQIEELKKEVINASTPTSEGRQVVANNCSKLYNLIEDKLYNKYGDEAIMDAYEDLCKGNFAEPFMCEQKKQTFELYSKIYLSIIK